MGFGMGLVSGAAKGYLEVRAKTVASADNATKSQVKITDGKNTAINAPVNKDNTMFPKSTIDQAVAKTMELKENHIFVGGLHDKTDISIIASQIGGRPAMIKIALQQVNGTFPSAGYFQRPFIINGHSIIMRGFVINSVPIINTMYIPK